MQHVYSYGSIRFQSTIELIIKSQIEPLREIDRRTGEVSQSEICEREEGEK